MTLPNSGSISIQQIASEFSLAPNTTFPSGFYGKGGAPSSGTLSLADFYGRSAGGGGSPPTITVSPTSDSVTATGTPVLSGIFSTSVSGGTTPYSYSWTVVSGFNVVVTNPSGPSTRTRADAMTNGESRVATFVCQVTDSLGATAMSNQFDVYYERQDI